MASDNKVYVEPDDYFPEPLRKKYKLGEYFEEKPETITKEAAVKIALNRNPKYDTVQEYEDAYEFSISGNEINYGGIDCSCIVEKETGKLLRWNEYFMDTERRIVKVRNPETIENSFY